MPDPLSAAKPSEPPKTLAGISAGTPKGEPARSAKQPEPKEEYHNGERKIVIFVSPEAGEIWDDLLAREHLDPAEGFERAMDDLANVDSASVDEALKERIGTGAFVAPCRKCGRLAFEKAEGDRELEHRARDFEHVKCPGTGKGNPGRH